MTEVSFGQRTAVAISTAHATARPTRTAGRIGLLLIVVGALSAALVVYRTGNRVDVLVAARTIPAGHKVTDADFTTTRVAADGGNDRAGQRRVELHRQLRHHRCPVRVADQREDVQGGPDRAGRLGRPRPHRCRSTSARRARSSPATSSRSSTGPRAHVGQLHAQFDTSSSGLSSGAVIVSAARVVDVAHRVHEHQRHGDDLGAAHQRRCVRPRAVRGQRPGRDRRAAQQHAPVDRLRDELTPMSVIAFFSAKGSPGTTTAAMLTASLVARSRVAGRLRPGRRRHRSADVGPGRPPARTSTAAC